jgi:tripartite-type tricarboxylate transporter receptor subunit TctC
MDKSFCALTMVVAAAIAGAPFASAQNYPTKPVRLVVPYAPGGAVDTMARVFGRKLSEIWSQPVIIDNRAGAGGNIGSDVVAKSAPDGYTLLMNTSGQAIAPSLYRKLPYDALKDLVPVTQLIATNLVLSSNTVVPITSVRELIALAKAQPGKLNFASTGVGSGPHLVGEMLKSMAGIDIVHVPYKGDGPLMPALFANEVQFSFLPSETALTQIKAGKLRALAIGGAKRSSLTPDIPTMIEAGVPDFEFNGVVGFFTTGGTPGDVVNKISADSARMLRAPDVIKFYAGWGVEPVGSTPEAFGAQFRSDVAKFAKIIREARIPQVD